MKQNRSHIQTLNRRDMLKWMLGTAVAPALIEPARLFAQAAPPRTPAKAIIQIWMWGGPCHLDTFDPKPDAGDAYTGPFTKPIAANVDGIRIGEMLPLLAKQADKYSIIPQHDPSQQCPRDCDLHDADRAQPGRAAGVSIHGCGGLAVQRL